MKSVYIYTHVYIFAVSADTEEPKCDPPWEKLHKTCVKVMKAKPFLTWQKARDSCISMNADLLSVNDKEENVSVYNINESLISDCSLMFAQLLGI
jgi:hypothetical protein